LLGGTTCGAIATIGRWRYCRADWAITATSGALFVTKVAFCARCREFSAWREVCALGTRCEFGTRRTIARLAIKTWAWRVLRTSAGRSAKCAFVTRAKCTGLTVAAKRARSAIAKRTVIAVTAEWARFTIREGTRRAITKGWATVFTACEARIRTRCKLGTRCTETAVRWTATITTERRTTVVATRVCTREAALIATGMETRRAVLKAATLFACEWA
jgi:hypothetical protein